MNIIVTGSIAYDYLMTFPGSFTDHILPDQLERISLSFLVDGMERRRGGCAPNVAYTLALLGERPTIMATAGQDFAEYRHWLEAHGVDTSLIRDVPGKFTASFFCNTDQKNNQIASFYTGAMADAGSLSFVNAPRPDLVIISRARTVDSKEKLVLAGATRAVNPQHIGGRRMAAFALNAHVAEFLDVVMHDDEFDFRIEQIRIPVDSPLCNRTLGDVDLEGSSGARLLAYRPGPRMPFAPHPDAETVLVAGSVLIAFGTMAPLEHLIAEAAPHSGAVGPGPTAPGGPASPLIARCSRPPRPD